MTWGTVTPKIFGLVNQTCRTDARRFRSINKIKPDEIFGVIRSNVKTVSIVRLVRNESAILKHNPVFLFPGCAKIDIAKAKCDPNQQCSRNQIATSNWLINLNVS